MVTTFLLVVLAASSDPGDRIVTQAQLISIQTYPRPTHVSPPRPGRFGEAIVVPLRSLAPAAKTYDALPSKVKDACRDAASGLGTMPPPCRAAAVEEALAVRAVLAATHAAEGGMPPGLRVLSDPGDPLQKHGWAMVKYAARLATWKLALEVERGAFDVAADTCVDLVAFGRDAMIGTGLVGMVVGGAIETMALRPCMRALDTASPERKRRAMEQLRLIRLALRHYSAVLVEEQTYASLAGFGTLLDGRQRRVLPPEAAAIVVANGTRYSWIQRSLVRASWVDYLDFSDALIASADLPPDIRKQRFAAASSRIARSLNPLSRVAAPDLERFAEQRDRAAAAVDLLREAVRADLDGSRVWPPPLDSSQAMVRLLDPRHLQIAAIAPGDELSVIISRDPPEAKVAPRELDKRVGLAP